MGSFRYVDYSLGCDTILINDKEYVELLFTDANMDCERETSSFVREDVIAKKLYYYSSSVAEGQEVLIADFGLEVGDTLQMVPGWQESPSYVLDSIYEVEFADSPYRFFHFVDQQYGYFEGLGNVWAGLLPQCNPNRYANLHDHEDSTESCEDLVAVSDWQPSSLIQCFPNPARDYVELHYSEASPDQRLRYDLYNTEGQRLLSGAINTEKTILSLENLPPGLFLLGLSREGQAVETHRIMRQ